MDFIFQLMVPLKRILEQELAIIFQWLQLLAKELNVAGTLIVLTTLRLDHLVLLRKLKELENLGNLEKAQISKNLL